MTTELDNPYRLPRAVLPRRYDLLLAPDLPGASFTGSVVVTLDVVEATHRLVLNAAELTIDEASVAVTSGGEDVAVRAVTLDPANERLVIELDRPLAVGPASLTIDFAGILNDKLRGFYRSTYTDDDGVEQVIATTQMQSTDCRRAFPCWDEPDFKAVFSVTLSVEPDLFAISNSSEASRRWSRAEH
ncbi:MAG: hypothetical protein R2705_03100 [Ilumatobacteraceae bacterium]